jgi:hypothetical protein
LFSFALTSKLNVPPEPQKATAPDAFSIWDVHNALAVEPSAVHIWVSPDSSRSGEGATLQIEE